jgi:hypothetical protein
MNQNVRTTDNVIFNQVTANSGLNGGAFYLSDSNAGLYRDNTYDVILHQSNSSGNPLYLVGAGEVRVSIDSNNNETAQKFVVGNNAIKSTNELFSVNESGTAYASGDFRAPIFYDSANTSWFADFASTSRMNTIRGNQIATTYHSVTSAYYGGSSTPATGYLITTNIDYGVFNMPLMIIEGYAYGNTQPINLYIVWYSYSPDPTGWTSVSYINAGGWDPGTITIGRNGSGKVCIHLSNNIYFGRFNVRCVYDQGHSYLEGWSVTEATTSGLAQTRTIPRTTMITDISGNAGSETLQTVTGRGQTSNQSLVVTGLRLTSTFDISTNDVYGNMRVIRNAGGGIADGMYIGYANAGSAITRIFGGGSTGGALEKYASYTYEPGSFRAPIFYDSDNTAYYADFHSTGTSINIQGSLRAATYNKPAILSVASGTASTGASFAIQQETGEGWTGIFVDYEPYTGWGFYHDNPNNLFSFTSEGSTGQIRSFTVPSRVSGNRTAYEKFRIDQNNGDFITGRDGYAQTSFRAPIFYDSDNTSYYVNPRSDSRMSGLRLDGVDNQASGEDAILWINKPNNNDWGIIVTGNLEYLLDLRGASSHAYNIRGLAGGGEFWRVGTDLLYHNSNIRAPIFYDQNDTNYYTDLNSTSQTATRMRGGIFFGPNPTWGSYLYVGTDGRQGLIDSAYPSVASTNGNLHMDAGSGYGMYLNYYDGNVIYFGSGTNGTWGEFSSGIFYAYNQMRSPIFYDYNNTGYYSDPNGTSRLNATVSDESYTYGWFRNYTNQQGLYNQANDSHWYSNGNYWKAGQGGRSSGGIILYQAYESSLRGYLYWDSSGFGLLNSSGNWQLRIEYGNANMELYRVTFANDMRAYIYYDRDNTGYYVDPNGTTNIYAITDYTRRAAFNLGRMLTTRRDITGDSNYWTGTWGWGTSYGNWDTAWESGFGAWDIWGTGTGHPQGGGYVHAQGIVSGQHYTLAGGSSAYGWMIVGAGDATPNRYWARGKWGGSVSGWLEFVMSGANPGYTLYSYIMYDANNTGYYIDPNNVSQLHYVLADNWFRPQGCTGLYFQSYGRGIWSPECEGNPYGHIATYGGGRNGWYGYGIGSRYTLMSTMGDNVGMHDSARGWVWYMSGAILYLYYASSERMSMQSYGVYVNNGVWAPIYYDHDTSFYFDGNGTTRWQGTDDYSKMRIGLTAKGNFRRNDYTGDTNYWVGSMGWGTTDLISVFTWGSGFFDTWGNPANQPAGTSHWVGVQAHHYVNAYNSGYGWQLVGGPISGAWWTSYWSSKRPWYKIAMYGLNEYSDDFYATIYYDANDTYWMVDPSAQSGNDKSIRVRGNISNSQYANDVYTPPGTIHIGRSDRNDYRSYNSLWYALKFTHSAYPGYWQWSHHLGGCCMFSIMHFEYNNLYLAGDSIGWGRINFIETYANGGLRVYVREFASGGNGDAIIAANQTGVYYSTLFRGWFDSSNSGWEKYSILITQQGAGGAFQFVVYGNGSTYNTTGIYGVWSDISLKQNIEDATTQWDDIKQLRMRHFKLKSDVEQFGEESAPKQLGLVAQEVEEVSPGLVGASDILEEFDEEILDPLGQPTGKTRKNNRPSGKQIKTLKQSILQMKALKALQEAMERIEVLEAEIERLKAS